MSGKTCLRKRSATLAFLIFCVSLGAARAQQETLLYNFCPKRGCPDGYGPYAGVVLDQKGNLYGTTTSGGGGNPKACNGQGCGVVFRLTPAGKEAIYSFCSQQGCPDGAQPSAGLVFDHKGNLYGTTYGGGAYGLGTVFRINPQGKETVLYSFCGQNLCPDGAQPRGGLVLDGGGNLYGTTMGGGTSQNGTVFKLTPEGKETVLHSFCGQPCGDGIEPEAGLVFDQKGNLYGTTVLGGSGSGLLGNGTVFKLTPEGNETVLYSFCSLANCTDGSSPYSSLVLDRNGNLYGTTSAGGIGGQFGSGVVFKLTPEGAETVLYSFCAQTNCTDGAYPLAGVVFGPSGNLYGTTDSGGAIGIGGVVFEVTLQGKEAVLHSFGVQNNDGATPQAGLTFDREGNLFGTTTAGGANHGGVVFKLAP